MNKQSRKLFDGYTHIHQHNTHKKEHFRHPFGKQEYMHRNFSFIGIYIWNFIIIKPNIMPSYLLFKCYLKTLFSTTKLHLVYSKSSQSHGF